MLNKVLQGEEMGGGRGEMDQSISSPGEETDWGKNQAVTPALPILQNHSWTSSH